MATSKISRFNDPDNGIVTVIEGEHGTVMHNFPEDRNGRWVKRGNNFNYVLTPNRKARRHTK